MRPSSLLQARPGHSARDAARAGSGLNLLLFNLAMDAGNPALGHVIAWTNELARRCEHVSVITMTAGEMTVEPNVEVHSLGKEIGRSEPRRLVEFYRLAHRVIRERRVDVCFAHMAPLFAVLFAPLAKARGIPILLWYSHGGVTRTLQLAHRVADRCVTPTPSGFRLSSDKVFVVGHGVDTTTFTPPGDRAEVYERTVLSVGRLTPIKRIDEMLRALAILNGELGRDLRLVLVGGPMTEADKAHEAALRASCRSLQIEDQVAFDGAVPFREVSRRYHDGGLLLNLVTDSFDKAILEGMASGCIPVSRNAGFRELAQKHCLDGLVPEPGPVALAQTVAQALDRPREEREQLACRLRQIVEEEHSLSSLVDRLIRHLTDLAARRR
jgi:glycosyltransferase involved in cell wall biosynthesis